MKCVYDDGGRALAGFKGNAPGDCVTRSIAIVTGIPYRDVYDALYERTLAHRPTMARLELKYGRHARAHASPRMRGWKRVYADYLASLGYDWCATMGIGTGCQVHLRECDLPRTPLIAQVSKHLTAVIDGVIHDTFDPSRDGTRCVYGFWMSAPDMQRWIGDSK